jgi:hypothetical protein
MKTDSNILSISPRLNPEKAIGLTVAIAAMIAASIFAPPLGGAVVLALATWKIGLISAGLAALAALVYAAVSRLIITVKETELPDAITFDQRIEEIKKDLKRNFSCSINIDGTTTHLTLETIEATAHLLKRKLGEEKANQILSYFYQSGIARDAIAILTAAKKKTGEMVSLGLPEGGDNNTHITLRNGICSVTITMDRKGELIPSLRKIHVYCHSTVANIFEKKMSVRRAIRLTNI